MIENFNSKKLFVLLFFGIVVSVLPMVYVKNGVSNEVSLAVVGILGLIVGVFTHVQGKVDVAKEEQKAPPILELNK